MKTREADIRYIFQHNLTRIEAIKNKSNLIKIQLEVKAVLQDYISVLDYIAMDLNSAGPLKPENRIYFPIYDKEDAFKTSANGSWVGLIEKMNIDIYNLILSIQPFKNKNDVLSDLSKFNNSNKHQRLLEMEQKGFRGQQVSIGNGAFVMGGKGSRMVGNFVNGMRIPDVVFDNNGIAHFGKGGAPRVPITITMINKEIISICGHNRDLFEYLHSVNKTIEKFSREAYALLAEWAASKKEKES